MAKKGPLGKAETFYIDHNYQLMTADDIASDLDRTVRSVENYIKKNHSTKKKKSGPTVMDQMSSNDKGSVVMTENASSIVDARKKIVNNLPSDRVARIRRIDD